MNKKIREMKETLETLTGKKIKGEFDTLGQMLEAFNEDCKNNGINMGGGDLLETVTKTLCSVDNAEFPATDSNFGYALEDFIGLEAGKSYIVIWDGEMYERTAYEDNAGGVSFVALGNKFQTGEDTGEPFLYMEIPYFSAAVMMDSAAVMAGGSESTYHTFSISEETTQLKPSLLPSHNHKWDDIEDAICWDRSTSEPLNITFDGNTEGMEIVDMNGTTAVKVSNAVLSKEQLDGSIMTEYSDGELREYEIKGAEIIDGATQGLPMLMVGFGLLVVVLDDISQDGITLTKGVWFMYKSETNYVSSLSNPNVMVVTGEIKKIDNKFIDTSLFAAITPKPVIFYEHDHSHIAEIATALSNGNEVYISDNYLYHVISATYDSIDAWDKVLLASKDGIYYIDGQLDDAENNHGIGKIRPLLLYNNSRQTELYMRSDNNTIYRVTVDDTGTLKATEVTS